MNSASEATFRPARLPVQPCREHQFQSDNRDCYQRDRDVQRHEQVRSLIQHRCEHDDGHGKERGIPDVGQRAVHCSALRSTAGNGAGARNGADDSGPRSRRIPRGPDGRTRGSRSRTRREQRGVRCRRRCGRRTPPYRCRRTRRDPGRRGGWARSFHCRYAGKSSASMRGSEVAPEARWDSSGYFLETQRTPEETLAASRTAPPVPRRAGRTARSTRPSQENAGSHVYLRAPRGQAGQGRRSAVAGGS